MSTFLLVSAHKWNPPSPPAALDYVADELKKMGIDSDIIDLSFSEDRQQLEVLLRTKQYDGVCITIRNLDKTAFSSPLHFALPFVRELIQKIRCHTHCPIIVGGNGFSIAPQVILDYLNADYGMWGGGEKSLPLLITYLETGRGNPSQIPHLVYNNKDHIVVNPPCSHINELPPVTRGYIDYHRYYSPGYENFSGFGNIETKRGCPHHCVYCVEPIIKGSQVRTKSCDAIAKEVEWFLHQGISYIFMTDSEFNSDCEAAVNIMQSWKQKGYHHTMKWLAYATPGNFSEKFAQLLPESGNLCITMDFGHISNRMLSNLGKSYTADHVKKTISLCQKYNVNFRGSLMLGGPGETCKTVKEAITYFKAVGCEIFLVLGIRVFPNTPLADHVQSHGPLVDNPNLYGKVINNNDLLEPVYYISYQLGEDIFEYISRLVGSSQKFYTIASPFKITDTISGDFRGVSPGYETEGQLNPQYFTKKCSKKTPTDP